MQGKYLAALLLFVSAPISAWGQAAGLGGISGTVHDATGSIVPGARVTVSNASLGITRDLNTTDGGIFAAPALVPASGYKVSVSKSGFAPYEAT
jgi:hypothetical protein